MAVQYHPRVPHTSWPKSRHCFTAKGRPKQRLTMSQARTARNALRRQGDDVEMYVCELCRHWHVGHRLKQA